MFSDFVKNSERYISGNYDIYAPNIDTNNFVVNIKTYYILLDVIEYWKPYKPYPNEIALLVEGKYFIY